jgi:Rieske Fe-S protein
MSLSEGELSRSYPDSRPAEHQPRWRQDFPTDVPEDDLVARREFTKFLVLTSGAFVAGQCWIGLTDLASPAAPPEMRLARLDDVPVGGAVEFRYPADDDPCLLLRPGPDRLVAYSQKCTHLSCAVVPDVAAGRLHCPCHNGVFEIAEGRPIAGPPRRPLPRVTLAIRDGMVYATGLELRTT